MVENTEAHWEVLWWKPIEVCWCEQDFLQQEQERLSEYMETCEEALSKNMASFGHLVQMTSREPVHWTTIICKFGLPLNNRKKKDIVEINKYY